MVNAPRSLCSQRQCQSLPALLQEDEGSASPSAELIALSANCKASSDPEEGAAARPEQETGPLCSNNKNRKCWPGKGSAQCWSAFWHYAATLVHGCHALHVTLSSATDTAALHQSCASFQAQHGAAHTALQVLHSAVFIQSMVRRAGHVAAQSGAVIKALSHETNASAVPLGRLPGHLLWQKSRVASTSTSTQMLADPRQRLALSQNQQCKCASCTLQVPGDAAPGPGVSCSSDPMVGLMQEPPQSCQQGKMLSCEGNSMSNHRIIKVGKKSLRSCRPITWQPLASACSDCDHSHNTEQGQPEESCGLCRAQQHLGMRRNSAPEC